MSHTKEIRDKIKSVKSTKKITAAMEMVAGSKLRKCQHRMQASRPYAHKMRSLIQHISDGQREYQHPFLISRPVKRVGFLVVSSDRGLCGSLNNSLFKRLTELVREWDDQSVPFEISTIGKKAENFFHRWGGQIVASVSELAAEPGLLGIIGTIKVMLDRYEAGEIDRLYLAYNQFVNTMRQEPTVELLLPIITMEVSTHRHSWDYLYEPEAKSLLDDLLIRYVETVVYQGVIENLACEQAARVVAMKNASDNAADLIDEFELIYNKARQASITQELSEIVAGASAV